MASAADWIDGARPRTLTAALSPVIAATGLAWFELPYYWQPPFGASFVPLRLILPVLCLIVAVALQIGANFINDYADGIRGTDSERVGPTRLVASGAATPRAVKRAGLLCFALAAAAGLIAVVWSQAWILAPVGLVCGLAAWFYTAGKRPYGYAGLGEVVVFVFFGLVATTGTIAVLVAGDYAGGFGTVPELDPGVPETAAEAMPWAMALLTGSIMGLFATAILVANNLRDRETDARAGKRTLAVLLGDRRTRRLYLALILAAAAGIIALSWTVSWYTLAGLVGIGVGLYPLIKVMRGAEGRHLIAVLKWTGLAELVTALALFFAWLVDKLT